jgi:hypothetical protein
MKKLLALIFVLVSFSTCSLINNKKTGEIDCTEATKIEEIIYDNPKYDSLFQILTQLDKNNCKYASFLIGAEYYHQNNYDVAQIYLDKSKGDVLMSHFYLALIDYSKRDYKSYEKTLKYLNSKGSDIGSFYYAYWCLYKKNYGETDIKCKECETKLFTGYMILDSLSNQGYLDATFVKANIWEDGYEGFTKDTSQALKCYRQIINSPNVDEYYEMKSDAQERIDKILENE